MTNLHQSVTVDDLYKLFGLRSTNYLRNNCHIDMNHLSNVDQPFASTTVTAPADVCEELLKLYDIDFHDNPLVTEMSKSPLEPSNHYFQPPLQSHQSGGFYITMEMQSALSEEILRYLQIAYQKYESMIVRLLMPVSMTFSGIKMILNKFEKII